MIVTFMLLYTFCFLSGLFYFCLCKKKEASKSSNTIDGNKKLHCCLNYGN